MRSICTSGRYNAQIDCGEFKFRIEAFKNYTAAGLIEHCDRSGADAAAAQLNEAIWAAFRL